VSANLVTQHANSMRHITSFVASLALPYLFTLAHKRHHFRKKEKTTENKVCVLIFSTTLVRHVFSFQEEFGEILSYMYVCLHVITSYSCRILMKHELFRPIFEKYPNIKFKENPSIGSQTVPCGQTDRHDEANIRFSQFCESARAYNRTSITAFWKSQSFKNSMPYGDNDMYLTRHTSMYDTFRNANGGRKFPSTRVPLYQTTRCHRSDGNLHIHPVETRISKNICLLNRDICTGLTKRATYTYVWDQSATSY
jgi:hypothetical protein